MYFLHRFDTTMASMAFAFELTSTDKDWAQALYDGRGLIYGVTS